MSIRLELQGRIAEEVGKVCKAKVGGRRLITQGSKANQMEKQLHHHACCNVRRPRPGRSNYFKGSHSNSAAAELQMWGFEQRLELGALELKSKGDL